MTSETKVHLFFIRKAYKRHIDASEGAVDIWFTENGPKPSQRKLLPGSLRDCMVQSYQTGLYLRFYKSPLSAANTNHQLHHISLNLLSVIHASSIYQPPSSRSPFSPQALWALELIAFAMELPRIGPTQELQNVVEARICYIDEILTHEGLAKSAFRDVLLSARTNLLQASQCVDNFAHNGICHFPKIRKLIATCEDALLLLISFLGLTLTPCVPGALGVEASEYPRAFWEVSFLLNPLALDIPESVKSDPWLTPLLSLLTSPTFTAALGQKLPPSSSRNLLFPSNSPENLRNFALSHLKSQYICRNQSNSSLLGSSGSALRAVGERGVGLYCALLGLAGSICLDLWGLVDFVGKMGGANCGDVVKRMGLVRCLSLVGGLREAAKGAKVFVSARDLMVEGTNIPALSIARIVEIAEGLELRASETRSALPEVETMLRSVATMLNEPDANTKVPLSSLPCGPSLQALRIETEQLSGFSLASLSTNKNLQLIGSQGGGRGEQKEKEARVTVTIFENQRFRLVKGWCNDLEDLIDPPAWCDKTGTLYLHKEFYSLPLGWRWKSQWKIVGCSRRSHTRSHSSSTKDKDDEMGWKYAKAFDDDTWMPNSFFAAKVRQRRWERVRLRVKSEAAVAPKRKKAVDAILRKRLTTEEQDLLAHVLVLHNQLISLSFHRRHDQKAKQNAGVIAKSPMSKRSTMPRTPIRPQDITINHYTTAFWLRRAKLPPAPLALGSWEMENIKRRHMRIAILQVIDAITHHQRQRLFSVLEMRGIFQPLSDALDWVLVQICDALVSACGDEQLASAGILQEESAFFKFLEEATKLIQKTTSKALQASAQLPLGLRFVMEARPPSRYDKEGRPPSRAYKERKVKLLSDQKFETPIRQGMLLIRRPWEGEWREVKAALASRSVCNGTGQMQFVDVFLWSEGAKPSKLETNSIVLFKGRVSPDPINDKTFVVEAGFAAFLLKAKTEKDRRYWLKSLEASAIRNQDVLDTAVDDSIILTKNGEKKSVADSRSKACESSSAFPSQQVSDSDSLPEKWHQINPGVFLSEVAQILRNSTIPLVSQADNAVRVLHGGGCVRLVGITRVIANAAAVYATTILADRRISVRAKGLWCEIRETGEGESSTLPLTTLEASPPWLTLFHATSHQQKQSKTALSHPNPYQLPPPPPRGTPPSHFPAPSMCFPKSENSPAAPEEKWIGNPAYVFAARLGLDPIVSMRRVLFVFSTAHAIAKFGVGIERTIGYIQSGTALMDIDKPALEAFAGLLETARDVMTRLVEVCSALYAACDDLLAQAYKRGLHSFRMDHRRWISNFRLAKGVGEKIGRSVEEFRHTSRFIILTLRSYTSHKLDTELDLMSQETKSSTPLLTGLWEELSSLQREMEFYVLSPQLQGAYLQSGLSDHVISNARDAKAAKIDGMRALDHGVRVRETERRYLSKVASATYWSKELMPEDPPPFSLIQTTGGSHASGVAGHIHVAVPSQLTLIPPPKGCEWKGPWRLLHAGWRYSTSQSQIGSATEIIEIKELKTSRESDAKISRSPEVRSRVWIRECREMGSAEGEQMERIPSEIDRPKSRSGSLVDVKRTRFSRTGTRTRIQRHNSVVLFAEIRKTLREACEGLLKSLASHSVDFNARTEALAGVTQGCHKLAEALESRGLDRDLSSVYVILPELIKLLPRTRSVFLVKGTNKVVVKAYLKCLDSMEGVVEGIRAPLDGMGNIVDLVSNSDSLHTAKELILLECKFQVVDTLASEVLKSKNQGHAFVVEQGMSGMPIAELGSSFVKLIQFVERRLGECAFRSMEAQLQMQLKSQIEHLETKRNNEEQVGTITMGDFFGDLGLTEKDDENLKYERELQSLADDRLNEYSSLDLSSTLSAIEATYTSHFKAVVEGAGKMWSDARSSWSLCAKVEHIYQKQILKILDSGFGVQPKIEGSGKKKRQVFSKPFDLGDVNITFISERKDNGKLPSKHLSNLVSFLCRYQETVHKLSTSHGWKPISTQLQDMISDTTKRYVASIKENMLSAMDNMVKAEMELVGPPQESKDGHVYTHLSRDLFSLLQKQISVAARQYFKADAFWLVLEFVESQIVYLQKKLVKWLESYRIDQENQVIYLGERKKTEVHVAAIINTSTFFDQHLAGLKEGEEVDSFHVTKAVQQSCIEREREIGRLNVEISEKASTILVSLMAEISRDCNSVLFTKAHDQSTLNEVIATLEDFFTDFHVWIKDKKRIEWLGIETIRMVARTYLKVCEFLKYGLGEEASAEREWSCALQKRENE
ncbi:hypothetical protein AAMO2058_000134400 [Amorphochlora amoebiformis]